MSPSTPPSSSLRAVGRGLGEGVAPAVPSQLVHAADSGGQIQRALGVGQDDPGKTALAILTVWAIGR